MTKTFYLFRFISSIVDIAAQFIVRNVYRKQLNPVGTIKMLGFVMSVTHCW